MLTDKQKEKNEPCLLFDGIENVESDRAHYPRVHPVIKYMQICFTTSYGYATETSKIYLCFHLQSVGLRLTCCDVGRNFCSGSIPGGVLRNQAAVEAAAAFSTLLRTFGVCPHSEEDCNECCEQLLKGAIRWRDELPPVSKFCRSLCESVDDESSSEIRQAALVVSNLIEQSLVERAKFFETFSLERSFQSRLHEEQHRFGTGLTAPIPPRNWMQEAKITGEIFPGQPIVHPRLDFGVTKREENARECTKNYKSSTQFSPGIFTVQCCCHYPKLLGISVMDCTESVSTALSVLLSRFKNLPKCTYYDNACNLEKSVILRVPWVNEMTRIACDRFHYASHKCNSVNDPAAHPSSDSDNTSNAEAMNSLWKISKNHSRFLSPENLMSFLCCRAAYLNLRLIYREVHQKSDVEDAGLLQFSRQILPCSCAKCVANIE